MLPKAGHSTASVEPFEKHKPLTTVDYEQQVDYLTQWINEWDNTERFIFIEKLSSKCDKEQIQFLWTVLQPTLHRDFVFSSLSAEPNCGFSPISIPVTREIHKHARSLKSKGKKVPLLKSAILRNEEDVRTWTSCSVLPIMKSPSPTSITRLSFRGSPDVTKATSGDWKCHQSYFGVRFPGIKKPHVRTVLSLKSAPPNLGYSQIKHQALRRHMQKRDKEQSCKKFIKREGWTGEDREIICSSKPNCSPSNKPDDCCQKYLSWHQMPNKEIQIALNWFQHRWNDWKRNEFLQVLLKTLEPSELFYISGLISVRRYRDFIALLPRKISRIVFSYLDVGELAVVSQVCRVWNGVANDEHLWKEKCSGIYIGLPLNKVKHWKTVYKENVELGRNWSQGNCTLMEISGHRNRVFSVSALDNLIASGSLDRTIKVWDAKSGNLLQTLSGHSKGVWSLCFLSKNILISGSHDTTIRVWNLRTSSCIKILMSHTGPVWALERKGDVLLSGSGDKTAKIWNIRQCQLVRSLIGHGASVFCVDIDAPNNRAFTGSADHTVRIWNLENGKCLKHFHIGGTSMGTAVTSLSYDQGFVATAAGDCVSVWNVESKKCTKEFLGHVDRIETVKLKLRMVHGEIETGFIYSAGKDGVVKCWNFQDGACIKSLRGHKASVNSLFVDDTKIVSASEDNKVRVWSFLPNTNRRKRAEKTKKNLKS